MSGELCYLGDGLYVKVEEGQVVLMANDAHNPSDTVYLEPSVLDSFIKYLKNNSLIPH